MPGRRRPVGAVVRPVPTLGPILEKVTDATDGKVVLAKVNVDENPGLSPGVPGAVDPRGLRAEGRRRSSTASSAPTPSDVVKEFVDSLLPTDEQTAGRRAARRRRRGSLRHALAIEPGNEDAIVALAELLVDTRRRPRRRWRCSRASPRPSAPARSPPPPASASTPTTTTTPS